jgi:hypothetical protein
MCEALSVEVGERVGQKRHWPGVKGCMAGEAVGTEPKGDVGAVGSVVGDGESEDCDEGFDTVVMMLFVVSGMTVVAPLAVAVTVTTISGRLQGSKS